MQQSNLSGHESRLMELCGCPVHSLGSVECLIRSIAQAVVTEKNCVKVASRKDEKGVTLILTVAPEDLRTLVGGPGRMAESMRTLVQSAGMKQQQRFSLRFSTV